MTGLIDFFLEPYSSASLLNIILEFIAAFFGVISVIYARKVDIKVFPTGIISTGIYVYMLSQWALYGDLIINIYYTLMSIYGWYMWSKIIDDSNNHIRVTRTNLWDKLKAIGIFLFTSVFVIIVYRYYNVMPNDLNFTQSLVFVYENITDGSISGLRLITPYIDTFTTGIFFAAMWLMANKKLENWTLWIIGDILSVPLYFIKGYGFTGLQYAIFLILAIMGYFEWKKQLQKSMNVD